MRQEELLWMVYFSLLERLPDTERPPAVFFDDVLVEFPDSWRIYYCVKRLQQDTDEYYDKHAVENSRGNNHQDSSASKSSRSVLNADISTVGESHWSQHVQRLVESHPACYPMLPHATSEELLHLCDRGRQAVAVDAMLEALGANKVFDSDVSDVVTRLRMTSLPRDVLWASALLLLMTGKYEGRRLLALGNRPYLHSVDRCGGFELCVEKVRALCVRSPVMKSVFLDLARKALNELCKVDIQYDIGVVTSLKVDVTYHDAMQVQDKGMSASTQAIWWVAACLSKSLDCLDSVFVPFTRMFPYHMYPFLLPSAVTTTEPELLPEASEYLVMLKLNSYLVGECSWEEFSDWATLLMTQDAYVKASEVTRTLPASEDEEGTGGPALWPLHLVDPSQYLPWKENPSDDALILLQKLFWSFDQYLTQVVSSSVSLVVWCMIGQRLKLFEYQHLGKFVRFFDRLVAMKFQAHSCTHESFKLCFLFTFVREIARTMASVTYRQTEEHEQLVIDLVMVLFECLEAYTAISQSCEEWWWNGMDVISPLPEHVILLDILQCLNKSDMLSVNVAESVLCKSVVLLPYPECTLQFFLIWFEQQPGGSVLFATALESIAHPSIYERISPECCWGIAQAMWRAERFESVKGISDCLKRRSLRGADGGHMASFYYLSVFHMVYGGAELGSASKVDSLESSLLIENLDMTRLPDGAVKRIVAACRDQPVYRPSKGNAAKALDLSSMLGCLATTSSDGVSVVPLVLTQVTGLQQLRLSHNNLTTLVGPVLRLRGLLRLDLSWNNITSLPESAHMSLPLLKVLNLSHNKIQAFPLCIYQWMSLEELHLNDNSIRHVSANLTHLTALKVLDLSNNELYALPKGMSENNQFQYLKISGNPIAAMTVTR